MSHLCNCICCFHLPPPHPPFLACLWPLSLHPCLCHCLPYLVHTLTHPTPTHAHPLAFPHHLTPPTHNPFMPACPHAHTHSCIPTLTHTFPHSLTHSHTHSHI